MTTMRPTDLASPDGVAAVVRRHHRVLGLPEAPATVELLDVRIRNPQLPDSPRCRGWATVRVPSPPGGPGRDDLVLLLHAGDELPAGGTTLPGLPLRVWSFPHDPGLPALVPMTDLQRAEGLLPGGLAREHVTEVRVVRWQPGVSASLRCALVGPAGHSAVYAKVLAHGALLTVDDVQRWLHAQSSEDLRVPEPLGADPVGGVLWSAEVDGCSLLDILRCGDPTAVDRTAWRTGRCLAALHASAAVPRLRHVEPADVVAEAAKKAAKVARAQPQHDHAVRRLAGVVAEGLDRTSVAPGLLHGDCHVGQLLVTREGPVLLDLDEMVTGDPAVDLAELAVDLVLRDLPTGTVRRFLTLAGSSYGAAGGVPPMAGVLRGYAAAELLNRCYRHLRRPMPGWQVDLAVALAGASDVLAGVDLVRPRLGSGVAA